MKRIVGIILSDKGAHKAPGLEAEEIGVVAALFIGVYKDRVGRQEGGAVDMSQQPCHPAARVHTTPVGDNGVVK